MIRQATLAKHFNPFVHLIVRKTHVMCCRCATMEPIHAGDGTPLPNIILALAACARRHPPKGKGRCQKL